MNSNEMRHMVIFCLSHSKGSAEAERFLKDGKEILTSIPGVQEFEVLNQVSPKNEYDYGFSMKFENMSAYEAYNAHPKHTLFVQERWTKEVTRFLEIDFKNKDL
jgi:hypothetical protein